MKEYYKFMELKVYHSSNNIPPNSPAEIITSLTIISKGGAFRSDLAVSMGSHGCDYCSPHSPDEERCSSNEDKRKGGICKPWIGHWIYQCPNLGLTTFKRIWNVAATCQLSSLWQFVAILKDYYDYNLQNVLQIQNNLCGGKGHLVLYKLTKWY